LRRAAERCRAFRKRIGMVFDRVSHFVKKLVDRDETRTAHVPVRLLHLSMQVYCCGEVLVEQLDGFCTDVREKRIVCMLHVQSSKEEDAEPVNPAIGAYEIVLDLPIRHSPV
jgi:hypothetical protein